MGETDSNTRPLNQAGGDGMVITDPEMIQYIKELQGMSDWHRGKHFRMVFRMLNNDRKVWRLREMRDKGLITQHQFLSMM